MERGLSRKHIVEGKIFSFNCKYEQDWHYVITTNTHLFIKCLYNYLFKTGLKASLARLQLEYIDVVFANRPDPNTPIEGGCAHLLSHQSFMCVS